MKILKLLVLSILTSTFFIAELSAQRSQVNEPPCAERIPALEIYSIEEDKINFNESDFENFDSIQMKLDNTVIPTVWSVSPIIGIGQNQNQDFDFENCKNYKFEVVAYCNSEISYSGITNYLHRSGDCTLLIRKNKFNEQELKIFPQPANLFFKIKNFSSIPIISINIFTINGEKILAKQNEILNEDIKIDISNLGIGNYIVTIELNNKSISYHKLIIGS